MTIEDLNTDLVLFYHLKWWRRHKTFLKWYWSLKQDEFNKQIEFLDNLKKDWKFQEFLEDYFIIKKI